MSRYVNTPWGQNWLNIAEPILKAADSGRLQRGLSYARGRVAEPEIGPGTATATVRGSSSYRVRITLPGPGRITADCDCPDPVWPCKHVVAVVFRLGRTIDEDPSALRTLRANDGYSADPAPEPEPEPAGNAGRTRWGSELAADALTPAEAFARPTAPLPDPVAIPGATGEPCYCPPNPRSGVDLEALEALAAVAAGTAMTALVNADVPGHQVREWPEDPHLDAVRIALHVTDPARLESLANAIGRTAAVLTGESLAWTFFGPESLSILTDQWQPDPALHHEVIAALAEFTTADGSPARVTKRMNRWTIHAHHLQLRYGRDERWYPFLRQNGKWQPAAPATADLAEAVARLQDPERAHVMHRIDR
jgi:hypothetical protein